MSFYDGKIEPLPTPTKTLTEQWREGKLPEDTYYVRFICGRYGVYEFEQLKGFGFDNDVAYIKEVLATVPSYEEWQRLQEQLKKLKQENTIHNNKAKKRRIHINNLKNENNQLREQLKEKNVKLNELRHQRNEANELISVLFPLSMNKERALERTAEYMEKWGVK